MTNPLDAVRDFWNAASCGEALYLSAPDRAGYEAEARERYRLEPEIAGFADFASASGKRVLEIGVGLGADHQRFAESGADLCGIDLTERAVEHTARRFAVYGLESQLSVGNAERLGFPSESFDLVYSWGVLHHTPDTQRAINDVQRVLRPGGVARIMMYHKWSLVGFMLWTRYALLRLRPWLSLDAIYSQYLESPGTKAYSVTQARHLFRDWRNTSIRTVLTHTDLLESLSGQRHGGMALTLARRLWPRATLKRLAPRFGLYLLIEAHK